MLEVSGVEYCSLVSIYLSRCLFNHARDCSPQFILDFLKQPYESFRRLDVSVLYEV